MKLRNGFVSNSSSSSFCIGKYFMTEEQMKRFRTFLDNREEDEEGYIPETFVGETEHYFLGESDQHDGALDEYLKEEGLFDKASFYQ